MDGLDTHLDQDVTKAATGMSPHVLAYDMKQRVDGATLEAKPC